MHYLLLVLFMFAISSSAHAIVNIEDMRITPELGTTGQAQLSLSGKSGNSDKQAYSIGGRLQDHDGTTTRLLIASYDYAESQGLRSEHESFIHLRRTTQHAPHQAWEIFAQAQRNEFANLTYRGLAGAGLRHTLAEQPDQIGLYLGTGAFIEREQLNDQPSDDRTRANLYLSYKQQISQTTSALATAYYQPEIGNADNTRALGQAALMVSVNDHLGVKLSASVTHDSQPHNASHPTDREYNSSLVYSF